MSLSTYLNVPHSRAAIWFPFLTIIMMWYSNLSALSTNTPAWIVCFTSLMASLIRSVGGLSNCFYQGLWLAYLNADVIGQSINRRGVASEFPYHVTVSSSFSARFLYGFPYRFQRTWMVLCSMKHPLDVARVGAWNSLLHGAFSPFDFCSLTFSFLSFMWYSKSGFPWPTLSTKHFFGWKLSCHFFAHTRRLL